MIPSEDTNNLDVDLECLIEKRLMDVKIIHSKHK